MAICWGKGWESGRAYPLTGGRRRPPLCRHTSSERRQSGGSRLNDL